MSCAISSDFIYVSMLQQMFSQVLPFWTEPNGACECIERNIFIFLMWLENGDDDDDDDDDCDIHENNI